MEILLDKKFFSTFNMTNCAEHICELNDDIVVPDTKEDILQIVLINGKCKIRSKDAELGSVTIRGEAEVNILYVPEKGEGPELLKTDIPFECEFEAEEIETDSSIFCDIKLLSVDARILNPRKVMLTVRIAVSQKCYCITDFTWYEEPLQKADRVFFKTDSENAIFISSVCEKTFSLEDEIAVNAQSDSAKIISADYSFVSDSYDSVGTKLIMKGHADISVLLESDGQITRAEKTINYSQIFDIANEDATQDISVCVLPTGDFFEITDGKINFEIHAVMQIVCAKAKKISYLSDAYACGGQIELSNAAKSIYTSKLEKELSESIELKFSSEAIISKVENINLYTGKAKFGSGEIAVPVTAEILFTTTENELRTGKIHSSVVFAVENEKRPESIDTEIKQIRTDIDGKEIRISASAVAKAIWYEVSQVEMITEASYELNENSTSRPSVYMCRAEDNNLWKLAKQYGSSVEIISELNNLDDTVNMNGRLLLIPRI